MCHRWLLSNMKQLHFRTYSMYNLMYNVYGNIAQLSYHENNFGPPENLVQDSKFPWL